MALPGGTEDGKARKRGKAPKKGITPGQQFLPGTPTTPGGSGWETGLMDRLFSSPIYKEQVQRTRRTAVDEPRLRAILEALLDRKSMTQAGLSLKLGIPAHRLGLVLNAVRRILNVEGYAVLEIHHESGMVTLVKELLEQQFDLKGNGP